ncbi:putative non-ribosomal peptide synthetase, partial [Paenibacillus sp. 598K]
MSAVQALLARVTDSGSVAVCMPPLRSEQDSGLPETLLDVQCDIASTDSFLKLMTDTRGRVAESNKAFLASPEQASPDPTCTLLVAMDSLHRPLHNGQQLELCFRFAALQQDELELRLEYNQRAYAQQTVQQIAVLYLRLLEQLIANPNIEIGEIDLLSESEWSGTVEAWHGPLAAYPSEQAMHELFERQVRQTPQQIAIRQGERSWTYAELNRR